MHNSSTLSQTILYMGPYLGVQDSKKNGKVFPYPMESELVFCFPHST
uniref:Uncharacterized protein n=1 Tax=Rhizophora mucronata TaxID=61149 RepID=A0A2P2PEI5_RHIMU